MFSNAFVGVARARRHDDVHVLSRSSGIDVYVLARHDTIYRVYLVTRQYIDVTRPNI